MKDLSFQEFVLQIQELVTKQLGMEYDIRLKTVQKNNGIERVGIVIGKKEEKVQPTIYLESYYGNYQKGTPITEIVMSILSSYDQFKEEAPEWKGQLSDMVDKVIFRIVGYEKNETLIRECPYIRYLDDLVLLFYIVAKEDEHGIGTIRITNQVLEQLDIDFEQLKKIAFANTRRMFPAVLQKMEDVIFQLVGDGDVSLDSKERNDSICDIEVGSGLYVLTNRQKICGAACMVYPDLLREISRKMDSDLLILPSSVHEVIITRLDSKVNLEDMKAMVCEINHTQVAPEEVLSDNVYVYYRDENTIKAA